MLYCSLICCLLPFTCDFRPIHLPLHLPFYFQSSYFSFTIALHRSIHMLSELRNTDPTNPTASLRKLINSRRLRKSSSRLCSTRSLFRGLSRLPRTTSTQWSSRSNRLLTPLCSIPTSTSSATLLCQEDILSSKFPYQSSLSSQIPEALRCYRNPTENTPVGSTKAFLSPS